MQPERVLDAPGMVDDFYLKLISWSVQNVVAVALSENTYICKADSGDVVQIGEPPEGSYVSSVDLSNDGAFLGIGIGSGEVDCNLRGLLPDFSPRYIPSRLTKHWLFPRRRVESLYTYSRSRIMARDLCLHPDGRSTPDPS